MTAKVALAIFLISGSASGQDERSPEQAAEPEKRPVSTRIEQILLIGNERTRDFVVLREMKTKVGDFLDETKIELDRLRIESLGLFTRVEIQAHETQNGVILLVVVTERWYIYPLPIFYFNERDWDKISYGVSLAHVNFLGRNEQLTGAFWLGYNPGFECSYTSPWLFGAKDLFLSASFFRGKVRSRSPYYEKFYERHTGVRAQVGRRFGYHTYLFLGFGYREISTDAGIAAATLSASGIDKVPHAGLHFRFDTRDSREYPHKGWRIDAAYTQSGLFNAHIDFSRYGLDCRRYQKLFGQLSLAVRLAVNFSAGTVPLHDKLYLGYAERVRGSWTHVSEGNHFVFGGAEFRFPLFKERYYDVSRASPLLQEYTRNLKFGLNGGIFYETAATFEQRLHANNLFEGFGVGLHFILPYIDVIRLEYACNSDFEKELIVDVKVAF